MLCIVEEWEGNTLLQVNVATSRSFPGPTGREGQHSLSCLVYSSSLTAAKYSAMDTDYILHRILRGIASWAVSSFFTEVRVIGGENVPMNGPIIVYVSLSSLAQDFIQYICCTGAS